MKLVVSITTIFATAIIGARAVEKKNLRNLQDGKAFNPILLGPNAVVPLFLECLEYGPLGMHPCSSTETIVAAYKDRNTDSRLKGKANILVNHKLYEYSGGFINFVDGIDTLGLENYPGEMENENYLLYCCAQPQLNMQDS